MKEKLALPCDFCEDVFTSKSSLKKHLVSHSEKISIPCDSCDNVFSTKASFKKHVVSHSENLQTCEECSQQFASVKGLAQHIGKVHKAEKKECDETATMSDTISKEDIDLGEIKSKKSKVVKDKKGSIKSSKGKVKSKNSNVQESKSLSVFNNSEPVHQYEKADPFDVWADDENDYKLMWWHEMGGKVKKAYSPQCHCRECRPCPHACCENIAVRTGLCCDPNTLGRCLQPYQAQCYAPCCHQSVQLRDGYRWVGGELQQVETLELINPLQSDCEEGNRILAENADNKIIDDEINTTGKVSLFSHEEDHHVPEVFSHQSNDLYEKFGKGTSKPNEFFKFYRDSSLPRGCRIVHKKTVGSTRMDVYYRSKCGKYFTSKTGLLSFLARSQGFNLENLYQEVKEDWSLSVSEAIPYEDAHDVTAKAIENYNFSNLNKLTNLLVGKSETMGSALQVESACGSNNDGIRAANKIGSISMNLQSQHHLAVKLDTIGSTTNRSSGKNISTKAPYKAPGKMSHCEECGTIMPLTDVTTHLVTKHPGVKMNRCTICKSGFMNNIRFNEHNQEYHAVDGSTIVGHPNLVVHGNTNSKSVVAELSSKSSPLYQPRSGAPFEDASRDENDELELRSNSIGSNDSFETMDKIEHFVQNTVPTQPKTSKSQRMQPSSGKGKKSVKTSLPSSISISTPSSSQTSKEKVRRGFHSEEKPIKRRKSMPEVTSLPKKRLRKSYAGYLPDDETPLKDTDPSHPTSSINLRTKGRNLKSKKLSEFDNLMKKNKLTLHSNQTINDVVNGEVHTIQSVKPECYFRVRGSGSISQMTNSSLLRRVGREHKGKMLLQRTQPLNSEEVVKDYMVNVGDRSPY